MLLTNDEFLSQMTILAAGSRSSSFTVTFKRYDGNNKPQPREGNPPLPEPEEYMCLMRVQSKSKKLSTVVKHTNVPKMMEEYSKVMKSSMDGLKRVKKVKNKAKAAQG